MSKIEGAYKKDISKSALRAERKRIQDDYVFKGGRTVKNRKAAMIQLLIDSFFNIGWCCKQMSMTPRTLSRWRSEDPEFNRACEDERNAIKDEVEVMMQKRIREKSDQVLIFWAKTQMKDRGYIEKSEIEHSGNTETTINLIEKSVEEIKDSKNGKTESS